MNASHATASAASSHQRRTSKPITPAAPITTINRASSDMIVSSRYARRGLSAASLDVIGARQGRQPSLDERLSRLGMNRPLCEEEQPDRQPAGLEVAGQVLSGGDREAA